MSNEVALLVVSEERGIDTVVILHMPNLEYIFYKIEEVDKMAPGIESSATAIRRLAILNHHLRQGYELKSSSLNGNTKEKCVIAEYYLLPPKPKT